MTPDRDAVGGILAAADEIRKMQAALPKPTFWRPKRGQAERAILDRLLDRLAHVVTFHATGPIYDEALSRLPEDPPSR